MQIEQFIEHKVLAAGPCSAENRTQVLNTAGELDRMGITIFRAGLWKPRTEACSFEGLGEKAIPWLLEARQLTGMKLATEVALPRHVEQCMQAGIDILWIGARTVSNPFAVRELASALQGFEGEVWIKNPISPEIKLWLGAFNRLEQKGLKNLTAVHRGFSNYDSTQYRNVPRWDIPIQLRNEHPAIRIICDPSHIGGKRDLILPLSQMALDLNFNGLMIECHVSPDLALSDAQQQVTPQTLAEIINQLIIKNDSPVENELRHLRASIDECDSELIALLARRMDISKKIGKIKSEKRIPVLQSDRYREMLVQRIEQAEKLNLDTSFIKDIFDLIHIRSIDIQTASNKS